MNLCEEGLIPWHISCEIISSNGQRIAFYIQRKWELNETWSSLRGNWPSPAEGRKGQDNQKSNGRCEPHQPRPRLNLVMDFIARFKESPIYSLILGLFCLGALAIEWHTGALNYHGVHRAGNWDFYFLLIFFGVCGLGLTGIGIWSLIRPSLKGDT
jgi:hypothetical protein